jgi:hypothetical protein
MSREKLAGRVVGAGLSANAIDGSNAMMSPTRNRPVARVFNPCVLRRTAHPARVENPCHGRVSRTPTRAMGTPPAARSLEIMPSTFVGG